MMDDSKVCDAGGCHALLPLSDNHRFCVLHDACIRDGVFSPENCRICSKWIDMLKSGGVGSFSNDVSKLLQERWNKAAENLMLNVSPTPKRTDMGLSSVATSQLDSVLSMLSTVLEGSKECGAEGCHRQFSSADNHRYCVKHDQCVYDGFFGHEECGECGQLVEVVLSSVDPPDMLTLVARKLLTQRWIQATRCFTHLTWQNQQLPHRLNISQTHKEWERNTGLYGNEPERERGRKQGREEARQEVGKRYSARDRPPNHHHSSHESNSRDVYDEYYNLPHRDHRDQRSQQDHRDRSEERSDDYKKSSSPIERSPLTQYDDGAGDPLMDHSPPGRSPSPPPAPSIKTTSAASKFGVGITATLLKILAERCVSSEAEANIAVDILTLLMTAVTEYNQRQGASSALLVLNRIAAEVNLLKNIQNESANTNKSGISDQFLNDSKNSLTFPWTNKRPPGEVRAMSSPWASSHQQQPMQTLPSHRASYQESLPPSAAREYGAMGSSMGKFMENKRQNLTPLYPQNMPNSPYNNNLNNRTPGYNSYPARRPLLQTPPHTQSHQYHNF